MAGRSIPAVQIRAAFVQMRTIQLPVAGLRYYPAQPEVRKRGVNYRTQSTI